MNALMTRLLQQRRRTVTNSAPNQPTISAGSLTSSGATLTGSAFSDPDVGDTQAAAQWQVTTSADTGYATPVISTGDDAVHLTSYAATGLSAATAYIARVRYKDNHGNYSTFSANASFTTSAGGPTTYASDDFNRADGALGTAVVGGAWTVADGAVAIVSNRASLSVSPSMAYLEASHADCTVSCTLPVLSNEPGLAFRATGSGNYWRWLYSSGSMYLAYYSGGVLTNIRNDVVTISAGDTISIVLSGTTIIGKVGATTVFTLPGQTQFQTATKHGVACATPTAVVDSFLVTS